MGEDSDDRTRAVSGRVEGGMGWRGLQEVGSNDGKWVVREACWGTWVGRDDTSKTGNMGKQCHNGRGRCSVQVT